MTFKLYFEVLRGLPEQGDEKVYNTQKDLLKGFLRWKSRKIISTTTI